MQCTDDLTCIAREVIRIVCSRRAAYPFILGQRHEGELAWLFPVNHLVRKSQSPWRVETAAEVWTKRGWRGEK